MDLEKGANQGPFIHGGYCALAAVCALLSVILHVKPVAKQYTIAYSFH